jgi:hypothetical protein
LGHIGFYKTKERISQLNFQSKMAKDIAKHIEICTTCQKEEQIKRSEKLTLFQMCTKPNQ